MAILVSESTAPYPTKSSRKLNGTSPSGKVLGLIIDKLSRLDPNVVSPRKRILREMERVSLEDQASKRRATPQPVCTTSAPPTPSAKQLSSYSITSILGEDKPSPDSPGFLRTLLKPDDRQPVKYSSTNIYPRVRIDPYIQSSNTSVHHPLYGLPMLPPGPYRAAPLWMAPHYPSPVHYPPPMQLYAPPHTHPSSPHYKDYREQTLTPPSGMHYFLFHSNIIIIYYINIYINIKNRIGSDVNELFLICRYASESVEACGLNLRIPIELVPYQWMKHYANTARATTMRYISIFLFIKQ